MFLITKMLLDATPRCYHDSERDASNAQGLLSLHIGVAVPRQGGDMLLRPSAGLAHA